MWTQKKTEHFDLNQLEANILWDISEISIKSPVIYLECLAKNFERYFCLISFSLKVEQKTFREIVQFYASFPPFS